MEEAGAAGVGGTSGGSEKLPNEPQKSSDPLAYLYACGKRAFAPPSSDMSGGVRSSSPPASPKKKRHCADRSSDAIEKTSDDRADDENDSDDQDDDAVVVEPSQQRSSTEKRERASSKTDARRILVKAIQDRVENPMLAPNTPSSSNSDEHSLIWATRVWDQLGVAGTLETAQLAAAACGGTAGWLRHQRHSAGSVEYFTRKRRYATAIVDVLSLLPRANSSNELPFAQKQDKPAFPHPSDLLEHPDATSARARERAQAAAEAVDRITAECSLLMKRMEEIQIESRANDEHQAQEHQTLQRWLHHLTMKVSKSSFRLSVCENALEHARHKNELGAMQLRRLILEREDELRASGDSAFSAELHAFEHVMRSSDARVGWQRYFRAESEEDLRRATVCHTKAVAKLARHQTLLDLMVCVKEQRERSLEMVMQDYAASQRGFAERAEQSLAQCVPVLVRALRVRFDFLSTQRTMAQDELSQKARALLVHIDFFGDDAPTKRSEIERAIHEFTTLRERAAKVMLEAAETQRQLWENRRDRLPSSVWDLVACEYTALWQQLSDSVHEVLQSLGVRVGLHGVSVDDETAVTRIRSPHLLPVPRRARPAPEPAVTVVHTTTVTTTIVHEEVVTVRVSPAFPETTSAAEAHGEEDSNTTPPQEIDDEQASDGSTESTDGESESDARPRGRSCALM